MKINNYLTMVAVAILLISLVSCAPAGYTSKEAGFFTGIWHGLIFFFSIVGKIFGAKIGLYAEHNSGFGYWLGFLIGIGGIGKGAHSSR
jgi:hypothetical protein